ncbi:hypothetical protein QJQ45_000671 [Haematococcus lacustris]|nr:hypothetical protein QJQ45_000671 [Haematococcus lacustris]
MGKRWVTCAEPVKAKLERRPNCRLGCRSRRVHDLMAIKLHGMHTPLNFVPETYNDIYKLMAMVDQALLIELLWAFSRIRNKLLVESARQHKRMTCEAGSEAMAMGDDVATRFDSAMDVVLRHDSVRDLMAIKLRGMYTPLNFVPETYNGVQDLVALVDQPMLLHLLRAFARKNLKLLAKAGRQQGSTIQEAALTDPDPAMHPDWSDASSPTAPTLQHQAGQPLAPPSAAAPGEAQCSVEARGWPCDAAGSEAAASLPPGKRSRRSAMALIGSAPLGSSGQGTSTGRCPSAAAACADTTASTTAALGLTQPAAPQLVGAHVVSLGVSKGRVRPAGRGWAEADALWKQADQVHEGGGGDSEAMLPSSSHDAAEQDSDAQENNQVGRLLPDAGSNAWYADSSEGGPRRAEEDVAGHVLGVQSGRAIEEEEDAGEGQPALRQYDPAPRPKQDLEQLVSAVEKELPFLSSSSQVEQTSQLLWCFADWARQPENSRARMTQAQCNAVMALLQCMAVGATAGKAGNPPAPPPLQQFDARQLSMAAWSLGKLKPHLPAAAVTSAYTALARHSASSEALKRGSWRDWSTLLHGLATAGMQCKNSPDLTRLCDQAVQLLPDKLALGAVGQDISMTLWAMAKLGYTGSAQPLLQSVTAAISQGGVMRDAKPQAWANLIWATSKLPGCREEARQLLEQFAMRGMRVERAAQTQQAVNGQGLANSLYGMARLGYLDSSVRSLAAGVAKADLAAFTTQAITNLLYARSMFLALSFHQAVSSGHSQLASEPQLNSMAAALWRECSRRGNGHVQWAELEYTQLCAASQWLHACTGGQIYLAASPALQQLVAKAAAFEISSIKKVQNSVRQLNCRQLVQALAAAGHQEPQQASLSQVGTFCALLRVGMELGLTRGISVDQTSHTMRDGSMSGVVAHVKLQQLTHFDAGVVVNKAVFDQLASDSERAAFMREQVRASLPEAEAWRQLLQAGGGHCAGQVEAPAAATPAAQQQQAVSVSAGQQARQQGALPLPAAQAKSAGALPSQRAGQAPELMPRPVRFKRITRAVSDMTSLKLGSDEAVIRECDTPLRQYDPHPGPKQDMGELIIAMVKLPYLDNSTKVEQTSQLLWRSADWARQPENSIAHMTEFKSISVLKLLQGTAGEPGGGTAGNPPAPLKQFDARQLSKATWSLGKLRPHLPAAAVTTRPGHSSGYGYQLGGHLRSPAPRTCLLPWLPIISSRTLSSSAHTLHQYDPAPRPKQDLEELVSAVKELPSLSSSIQVEQTSQLLWCFADWARQPENSRARMTQAECNAVMALLQHMAGDETAGDAPALPLLQQLNARQLSMSAWSLGKLKPHLPAAAVTSACTALASHSASSEAMKEGGWREWSNLLHGLATAGMQCSSSPDLTWLYDQAVQLLPVRLARGVASQNISMTLWAMAKSGYTGSAQPLLQSVTAAISQGKVMRDAKPQEWANLIWAASKLPGHREEARQLFEQFAIRGMRVVPALDAQNVSNILYAMGMFLWHDKEVCRQLAERAVLTQQSMKSQEMSNSLYGLARLGYLDSSVRSLAARVAKADLTAFKPQHLANLLYARSMFLALSIHQAVSSGHSQLASEPQLNSMAAALWRECSRRGQGEGHRGGRALKQLYTASQWLHACTAGQISLATSPALQDLVAKAAAKKMESTVRGRLISLDDSDNDQLFQALANAGHSKVQQAVLSQNGTCCAQLLVLKPGLTRGISVEESPNFLQDGSMSGVVAHVKLQQLTHFDAAVVVDKAVFDQLANDRERAAFMREQVRASLPEAVAWQQLLQAGDGHCAGQVEAPAAATPAALQQQAVSVSAGQQARQQGALPLPAAQAKSAGALPSQRAGQAPGLMPRPVRPKV